MLSLHGQCKVDRATNTIHIIEGGTVSAHVQNVQDAWDRHESVSSSRTLSEHHKVWMLFENAELAFPSVQLDIVPMFASDPEPDPIPSPLKKQICGISQNKQRRRKGKGVRVSKVGFVFSVVIWPEFRM